MAGAMLLSGPFPPNSTASLVFCVKDPDGLQPWQLGSRDRVPNERSDIAPDSMHIIDSLLDQGVHPTSISLCMRFFVVGMCGAEPCLDVISHAVGSRCVWW